MFITKMMNPGVLYIDRLIEEELEIKTGYIGINENSYENVRWFELLHSIARCSCTALFFDPFVRSCAFRATADSVAVTSALATAVVRGRCITYCMKHAGPCRREGRQIKIRSTIVEARSSHIGLASAWCGAGLSLWFPHVCSLT